MPSGTYSSRESGPWRSRFGTAGPGFHANASGGSSSRSSRRRGGERGRDSGWRSATASSSCSMGLWWGSGPRAAAPRSESCSRPPRRSRSPPKALAMSEAPARLLVVDDEENMVHFLPKLLRGEGFEIEGAGTGEAALEKLRAGPFDLVLTDLKLPDTDGIEILKAAPELHPETVVVLITAYGTIGSAIEAMRAGGYDYVTKPFRAGE